MHEYVPPVLEAVFEAEWLRREGVFSRPWKKGSREWSRDDAFEGKLHKDRRRKKDWGRKKDKSLIVETR